MQELFESPTYVRMYKNLYDRIQKIIILKVSVGLTFSKLF